MEDYKKKYEEAFGRARVWKEKSGMPVNKQGILDDIFPELRESESEDERIRKDLIGYFEVCGNRTFAHHRVSDIITWLEKQGNISPTEDELEALRIAAYEPTKNWSEKLQSLYKKLVYCKQGEQRHADKVEPKFKIGDWIINGYGGQITSIEDNYLCYKITDSDGIKTSIPFTIQNNYHLWTIQDAKDGDVIVFNDEFILIFKEIIDLKLKPPLFKKVRGFYFKSYVNLDFMMNVFEQGNFCDNTGNSCHPATKEQRDILFQKMKEAGYEWDAEKKELKKIEQKPTEWSDRDWYYYSKLESFLEVKDHYSPTESSSGYQKDVHETLIWLKSMRPNKHVTWSEDDEKMCQETIDWFEKKCFPYALESENPARESIKWLKSLKDRVQLQPKQEERGDVVSIIEHNGKKWVRVCVLDEDFLIAARDYREGETIQFDWKKACEIGTFSQKQASIVCAFKDEINAKLRDIDGDELIESYYWTSSAESNGSDALAVNLGNDAIFSTGKHFSYIVRPVYVK